MPTPQRRRERRGGNLSDALGRADIAAEFLRRNHTYRAEHTQMQQRIADGAVAKNLQPGLGDTVGEPGIVSNRPPAGRGADLKPRLPDLREHVAMDHREAETHLTHRKDAAR